MTDWCGRVHGRFVVGWAHSRIVVTVIDSAESAKEERSPPCCKNMITDMCVDMCVGMCVDMCMDMCIDTSMDCVCLDMWIDMWTIDTCLGVRACVYAYAVPH